MIHLTNVPQKFEWMKAHSYYRGGEYRRYVLLAHHSSGRTERCQDAAATNCCGGRLAWRGRGCFRLRRAPSSPTRSLVGGGEGAVGPILLATIVGIAEPVVVDNELASILAATGDERGVVLLGDGVVDLGVDLHLDDSGGSGATIADGAEALERGGPHHHLSAPGARAAVGAARVSERVLHGLPPAKSCAWCRAGLRPSALAVPLSLSLR